MDRRITLQTMTEICSRLNDEDLGEIFWIVSDFVTAKKRAARRAHKRSFYGIRKPR